jgi:cell division septation protein DedD
MTVQKKIIEGVSELLYLHDYVVVPDFGGFVSRQQQSHYSLNKAVLFPPSKKVMFNVQLKQNDGVLSNWLKDQLDCSFIEANRHLEEFASYCRMLLHNKKRLEFENLGLFYLDFENNICFEPKADINFLIDSFGLSGISLRELEPEVKQAEKVIEPVDRIVTTEQIQTTVPAKKRNYRRMAALAIGIPVVGAMILFAASQMKPNSFLKATVLGQNSATYTPINYSGLHELSSASPESYVVDANGYASVDLFENDKLTVVNIYGTPAKVKPEETSHRVSFAGKYQVVMGCFSVESNAKRLIKKLSKEHVKAGISGVNAKGLHVVSCGGFDDKTKAAELLSSIKPKFPSAWIMTQE